MSFSTPSASHIDVLLLLTWGPDWRGWDLRKEMLPPIQQLTGRSCRFLNQLLILEKMPKSIILLHNSLLDTAFCWDPGTFTVRKSLSIIWQSKLIHASRRATVLETWMIYAPKCDGFAQIAAKSTKKL